MNRGKKAVIAIAVLVAVALVSGLTTLAVTSYGSQSDPLVTLSYLNETVTPAIRAEIDAVIDAKVRELEDAFAAVSPQLPGTVAPGVSEPGTGAAQQSGFKVLTLMSGQTVTCEVGAEIMLRIGSAVSAGPDSPRLVDETDGESVAEAGKALAVNHMYMVTIINNGVVATANNTKILIRGTYTVS